MSAENDLSIKETVLLVDDDPLVMEMLKELIRPLGCQLVQAGNLDGARKAVKENPSISVALCDHFLPDGNGLNFLQEIKSSHPTIVRLLITGFPDPRIALDAINHGEIYRFITKPFVPDEVVIAVRDGMERCRLVRENRRLQDALVVGNEQLQKSNRMLEDALTDSMRLCMDILDRYDHLLASHSSRVAKWATAVGKSFALSLEQLKNLELAAQLHDIGLVSVSREYHSQQQTGWEDVPPQQQAALQMHPKIGADLVRFLRHTRIPEIIAAHHEWYNGEGYPGKLAQEQIPFLSSIITVPDAFDEFPGDQNAAVKFIEESLGTRFHPEVGRAFLRLVTARPDLAEREKEVLISELQPGMKLTCDVLSASGIVLATRGQVLIPKLVQYIRQHDQSEPLTQRIFVAA